MRRVLALLLLLVVAAPPAVAAPEPRVTGRVLGVDGRPLRGDHYVRVTERVSGFDVFAMLFTMTFGGPAGVLACIGGGAICREAGATTVRLGGDGRFSVPVPSGVGDYDLSVLSFDGKDTDAHLTATFDVPANGLRLPPLRLWDPHVRTSVRGEDAVVEWDPLPADYAPEARYKLLHTQESSGRGVFVEAKVRGTVATLPGRDIEDAVGEVYVVASGRLGAAEVRWPTDPVTYRGGAGAPPSRGAPCRVRVEAAGEAAPAKCWLTDGDRNRPYAGQRARRCWRRADIVGVSYLCGKSPVTSVTIDLGEVREVAEVRRVTCLRCSVSVSEDGRTWTGPQPIDFSQDDPIAFEPGTRGRYVRIAATPPYQGELEEVDERPARVAGTHPDLGPNDLGALREVAVWPPRPPAEARRTRGGGDGGDAEPAELVDVRLLGIVAAFAVVIAGAYAAGRRGS